MKSGGWKFEWTAVEPQDWAFAIVICNEVCGAIFYRWGFSFKKGEQE